MVLYMISSTLCSAPTEKLGRLEQFNFLFTLGLELGPVTVVLDDPFLEILACHDNEASK